MSCLRSNIFLIIVGFYLHFHSHAIGYRKLFYNDSSQQATRALQNGFVKSINVLGGAEYFFFRESLEFRTSTTIQQLPPIVFAKVHKTGSETVTNMFDRMADIRDLISMHPSEGYYQLGWPDKFPGAANYPSHSVDMIIERAIFNPGSMSNYLKKTGTPNFYFAILNDPWNQTMQAYNDFKVDGMSQNISFAEQISWMNSITHVGFDKKTARFLNSMATDLGWYFYNSPSRTTQFDRNDDRIDLFISAIDKSMDLIMITDEFDKGIILLGHLLNITLEELYYARVNVKDKTDYVYPDESLRKALYDTNYVDNKLYRYFVEKFNIQWRDACRAVAEAKLLDPSIELLELRLQRLQTVNAELEIACAAQWENGMPVDPAAGAKVEEGGDYKSTGNSKIVGICSKSYIVTNHQYTDYFREKHKHR